MPIVDLHTHTTCSDGCLSPDALVAEASRRGIAALAITDHDTVDGLAEGFAAGHQYGVEVIAGIELSVTVREEEVHLLGYGFDEANDRLTAYLRHFRDIRRQRAEAMVGRLHGLGVMLPWAAVAAQAGDGVFGRPHVARALAAEGWCVSYEEAFATYLHDDGPAFVAKPRFPAREALQMLHNAGGIGVLAHPGHWTADAVVMQMIQAGLDGIEVVHPAHDDELTAYYRQLAADFFLIETGGSDYHGFSEHDDAVLGTYGLSPAQMERLRRRLPLAS